MRARFGDWVLDSDARELRRRGERIHIAPHALHLLELLIKHRPKAICKKELCGRRWPRTFVSEGSLTTVVKELRAVLGDRAQGSRFVRTIFGHGYSFAIEAKVEETIATIESLAVLPFENTGGVAEWQYLSDGIAEELVNALVRLPQLRVVPCSSSFRHRGQPEISTVARALRVDAIVTGRVSRRSESLTIQAELIDTVHDTQLWGDRFHRNTDDLQRMQSDIAIEIAGHLASKLT